MATNSHHGYFYCLWRIRKPSIAIVGRTYFYADDLVIGLTVRDHVQHAMRNLELYCSETHLNVSVEESPQSRETEDPLHRDIDSSTRVKKLSTRVIPAISEFCYQEHYQSSNNYITRKRDRSKPSTSL